MALREASRESARSHGPRGTGLHRCLRPEVRAYDTLLRFAEQSLLELGLITKESVHA